jgi:DnaK suppressor protein
MRKKEIEAIQRALLRQRKLLLKEVADTEADLAALDDAAEIEFEEVAQDEQMRRLLDRLDRRAKVEVEDIDRALARIAAGSYGICIACGESITSARLQALPATTYCISCATAAERGERPEAGGESPEAPPRAELPPEYALLSDHELRDVVREQLAGDDRLDLDELRIVCRHGVLYLDGEVPSLVERQILLHTLADVMGLTALVDRVRVAEARRQHEDRTSDNVKPARRGAGEDRPVTEDVVEAAEGDADFDAPSKPLPDTE